MVKSLDRMGLQQVTRLREPVGRLTTLLIVAQFVRDHVFREDTSMRADFPEGECAILEQVHEMWSRDVQERRRLLCREFSAHRHDSDRVAIR